MLFNKVSVSMFVFGLLVTLQGLGELFSLNGPKKKGGKKRGKERDEKKAC